MAFRFPAKYRLAICIIVILVSLVSMIVPELGKWRENFSRPDRTKPAMCLGKVSAEETVKLIDGKGKVLIVVPEPTGNYVGKALEAFQRQMGKEKMISVVRQGIPLAPSHAGQMYVAGAEDLTDVPYEI